MYKRKIKGGNILNISGPTRIGYFFNKEYNKKIIIIGDIHGNKNGSCIDEPNESIFKYLKKLEIFKPIDIFVESDIPSKKILDEKNPEYLKLAKNLIAKDKDYISEIIHLAYTEYMLNDKKRYHFIDIRYNIKGFERFYSFDTIIYFINFEKIIIDKNNLSNLFEEFMNQYVFSLCNIIRFIENPDFDSETNMLIVPEFFYKEYKKLFTNNKESLNKIITILTNYIKAFLDIYFDLSGDLDINLIKDIYHLGITAGAAVTDFYTISRIMKSKEFNDCVIYGGLAHYFILQSYLDALGFELKHEFTSEEENFRCVKNVIDFNDFFKSN